jgi:hypothetical protein
MVNVEYERDQAKQAAWVARTGLRRRLEAHPVEVESKTERWQQQAEETAEARAAEKSRRRHVEQRQLQEERRHELNVAQSWGQATAQANVVCDADVLGAINSALSKILDRVENLEARVKELGSTAAAAGRRLDALSSKSTSRSDKVGRQVSVVERRAEEDRAAVADLRTDVKILRAKVHALESRPQQAETHVIREVVHG